MSISDESIRQLRERAEQAIRNGLEVDNASFREIQDYVHELQVYQVELEMQADELRHTRNELERSRDELAELYENAPVGYLTLTGSGIVLRANQTFAELLNVERETLVRRPLARYIAPGSQQLYYTICQKAGMSKRLRSCELEFLRDDGSVFHGRLDMTPEPSGLNAEPCFRVTVSDISDKIHSEQERLRLQRELLKFQKEDSLKRLAGGIAHNFNNHLSVVIGNVELLQDITEVDTQQRKFLTSARLAAEQAAELSRMMLCYLGQPLSRPIHLDLHATVTSLVKILRNTMHGNLVLSIDENERPATVQADPGQIAQIVNNLVQNSLEAIGDGSGTVTIRVYRQLLPGKRSGRQWTGQVLPAGEYACLEIADNGRGMDDVTLERAVDPFFTTNFTGRGMGLSATWGIAKAHNGTMEIESEIGEGTTVKVYLPVIEVDRPRQPYSITGRVRHRLERRGGRILYVDDDPVVRAIGARILAADGYEVLEAGGGVEAMKRFMEHQGAIECVVVDYAMPDMDGNAVIREIRETAPDCPILMVSGFLEEQAVGCADEEKPDRFLQKPLHREELLRTVAELIDARSPDV